ncbi:hypothetical protein Tco_1341729, partial [Tanacetum coccineum]
RCVFEDVKFTNMVGLGKLPLDLKEIVKSVTHGASIKTKKSERKARAQVTPTETDGVAITEVEMGDTSSLIRFESHYCPDTSTIFWDTHKLTLDCLITFLLPISFFYVEH